MLGKKDLNVKINTIIGKGAECQGDFSANDSVRMDGTINGNVTVAGAVIIGATGLVNGNITAKSVVVGGQVLGGIEAPERVELIGTAQVFGDITTGVLVVDEKAVFQGKCNMNKEMPTGKVQPGLKAVRSGKKTAKAAIVEALRADEEELELDKEKNAVAAISEVKTEDDTTEA